MRSNVVLGMHNSKNMQPKNLFAHAIYLAPKHFCACVWSSMPKIFWSNKSPIFSERVVWFCWFFASSYLHLVRYHWGYKNMLFWAGIVRHSFSVNQIVCCFKLKKFKKDMRYQLDFFLSLKLEEILCYFGLWPQNTLGQSICRMFYIWLVKLNTGGPLLHCTYYFLFHSNYFIFTN